MRYLLTLFCCALWVVNAAEILTNREIIEMHNAGLSESIIKEKIGNSESIFDMSARALIELQKNKIPETLIQLMQQETVKTQRKVRAKIAAEIQNMIADNEEIQRSAKLYLKKVGTPSLPQLRENLHHNNPAIRVAAITMLGSQGDNDSLATLRELLTDSDEKVRYAAGDSLKLLDDQAAIEMARTALRTDLAVVDGYVHLLGCFQDVASADLIGTRLLRAYEPSVRSQAAWALGEMRAPPSVKILSEALQNDNENSVKAVCATALGKIADPESFTLLSEICRNHPALRVEVLSAIGAFPAKLSAPFLIAALAQAMKPEEKKIVLQALRKLIGRDFGDDLAAWNKWLEENQNTL